MQNVSFWMSRTHMFYTFEKTYLCSSFQTLLWPSLPPAVPHIFYLMSAEGWLILLMRLVVKCTVFCNCHLMMKNCSPVFQCSRPKWAISSFGKFHWCLIDLPKNFLILWVQPWLMKPWFDINRLLFFIAGAPGIFGDGS